MHEKEMKAFVQAKYIKTTVHYFKSYIPFMLLCHWIPRHVYRFDWAKGHKCLTYSVFLQLKTYTAHIYSAH